MATSRRCFVPGCKTGYESQKRHNPGANNSLFKAPKDPEQLKKWQRAIPRDDRLLAPNNVVCELHFTQKNIIRYYETKLPDGKINKIRRGRPLLRPGSVPCIFPNLPTYLTKLSKERKAPLSRRTISKIEEDPLLQIIQEEDLNANQNQAKVEIVEHLLEIEMPPEITLEEIMFNDLKTNVNSVLTPSPNWGGLYVSGLDQVVFAEWTENHACLKKIIIKSDMAFKVLLGSTEIKMETEKINNLNDIEVLLKKVHQYKLCLGVSWKSSPDSCNGYLPERKPGIKGRLSNKCMPCRLAEKGKNKKKNWL